MFDLCPNCRTETTISSYRHKIDEHISYFLVKCNKCGDLWQHEWVLPHTYKSKLLERTVTKKSHRKENFVRVIGNSRRLRSIAVASMLLVTLTLTPLTLEPSSQPQAALAQPSPFSESSPFLASEANTSSIVGTNSTSDVAGLDLLRIGMFIFGIDNDTGNVVTYVTARNMTKAGAEDAMTLDRADNATDGIAEVYYSFPEISTKIGDKFEACALKVNDQSIQCTSGFKSPVNRTEVAQVLIGDQLSNNINQ